MSQRFQRITAGLRKNVGVLRRAESCNHPEDGQGEAEVADAICNEGLAGCVGRFLSIKVVTDEQVGTEPDSFPADKHHQEIRAHHQHEHRKHEEAHVGKEAIEPRVAVHVAGGKNEDAESDARHDQHEDRRKRIKLITPLDVENRTTLALTNYFRSRVGCLLRSSRRLRVPTFFCSRYRQPFLRTLCEPHRAARNPGERIAVLAGDIGLRPCSLTTEGVRINCRYCDEEGKGNRTGGDSPNQLFRKTEFPPEQAIDGRTSKR